MRATIITLSILMISLTITSFAFDGQRQGFVMGIGGGPAFISYNEIEKAPEIETREYEAKNNAGLKFHLKTGYSPSEQLSTYIKMEISYTNLSSDAKTTGLTGLGTDYYLKPDSPSLYFTSLVGISWWNETLFGQYLLSPGDGFKGLGFEIGIGYEFKSHLSAELTFSWANPSNSVAVPPDSQYTQDKTSPAPPGYIKAERTYRPISVGLTINALGY
jgi:hypothetical protein